VAVDLLLQVAETSVTQEEVEVVRNALDNAGAHALHAAHHALHAAHALRGVCAAGWLLGLLAWSGLGWGRAEGCPFGHTPAKPNAACPPACPSCPALQTASTGWWGWGGTAPHRTPAAQGIPSKP
jgi:hypothetical protein